MSIHLFCLPRKKSLNLQVEIILGIISVITLHSLEDCLSLQLTNAMQIEGFLSNVNTPKAWGHDMVPPRLTKESSHAIAGPVAKNSNTSIAHSRYPSRWKMVQVPSLFKRDEELENRNYRPVTVQPGLKNIFERLLSDQL